MTQAARVSELETQLKAANEKAEAAEAAQKQAEADLPKLREDLQKAQEFYDSDHYKPLLEMRLKAGKSKAILVDGHNG